MRIIIAYLYTHIKESLATAPWKGLVAMVPGFSLQLVESLTAIGKLTGVWISVLVGAMTAYTWIEARIKKSKGK